MRASPPASRGWPSTPISRGQRGSRARRPRLRPAHYRRLIALRHAEPVVAHGDFTMLLADDPRVYAFTRALDDVELLVLGNFSGGAAPVELDLAPWAELILSTTGCRARWVSCGRGRRACIGGRDDAP